jgi:transposase-like protein
VNALVEGNSVRATARVADVEHKTVLRVLLRVGEKCQRLLDEKMRGLVITRSMTSSMVHD